MKKIKRNLLVAVVLMLGTFTNYANVEGISNKIKAVKVIFENVEKGHELTVKNHAGIVIYNEDINQNGELIKFFDFSHLNNGVYTIEVEKEYEILIKEFEVKNTLVSFHKEAEKTLFRPVILTKKDRIFISRINFDKSPLNVAIYYNDEIIVEETISSEDKVLEKCYHLDLTVKGNYRAIVSNTITNSIKEFTF